MKLFMVLYLYMEFSRWKRGQQLRYLSVFLALDSFGLEIDPSAVRTTQNLYMFPNKARAQALYGSATTASFNFLTLQTRGIFCAMSKI